MISNDQRVCVFPRSELPASLGELPSIPCWVAGRAGSEVRDQLSPSLLIPAPLLDLWQPGCAFGILCPVRGLGPGSVGFGRSDWAPGRCRRSTPFLGAWRHDMRARSVGCQVRWLVKEIWTKSDGSRRRAGPSRFGCAAEHQDQHRRVHLQAGRSRSTSDHAHGP